MSNNKYQKAKIYKLVNSVGTCYYGTTCKELYQIKESHEVNYQQWKKNEKNGYRSSFKLYEEDPLNVNVILVENYPCNSKYELNARKRYYIENNFSENKIIPNRTRKEWQNSNKTKINIYMRIYMKNYRKRNNAKMRELDRIRYRKKYKKNKNKKTINKKKRKINLNIHFYPLNL